MTSAGSDLEQVLITEREHWRDGPPHELFGRLRGQCRTHWTSHAAEYAAEAGYWSVTRAQDVHTVSRDWRTYSSERGGITAPLASCSWRPATTARRPPTAAGCGP